MLAIVAPVAGRLEWTRHALELAEASSDPRCVKWPGSLYNNLGWTCHEQGRYEQALEYFRLALVWRERQGVADLVRVARWCIARCLRSLGQVAEALRMQEALQAGFEADGTSDGYVCEELGECLLALGRAGEARPWFARAHAVLAQDTWLRAEEPERLARLQRLGQGA